MNKFFLKFLGVQLLLLAVSSTFLVLLFKASNYVLMNKSLTDGSAFFLILLVVGGDALVFFLHWQASVRYRRFLNKKAAYNQRHQVA